VIIYFPRYIILIINIQRPVMYLRNTLITLFKNKTLDNGNS